MFSNCLKRSEVLVLAPELESEFSNIAGDGTFKGDDFALAMARASRLEWWILIVLIGLRG